MDVFYIKLRITECINDLCLWIIQGINRTRSRYLSQRLFDAAELYNTKPGEMNYFVEGARKESPEFDDHDFEPILEWADAKIEECLRPHDNKFFGYTLV